MSCLTKSIQRTNLGHCKNNSITVVLSSQLSLIRPLVFQQPHVFFSPKHGSQDEEVEFSWLEKEKCKHPTPTPTQRNPRDPLLPGPSKVLCSNAGRTSALRSSGRTESLLTDCCCVPDPFALGALYVAPASQMPSRGQAPKWIHPSEGWCCSLLPPRINHNHNQLFLTMNN